MLHHLERKRSIAVRTGWRMSTSGAATAPLCLRRKARFVPSADSSAQIRPTPTARETPVTLDPSSERSSGARALPPVSGPGHTNQLPSSRRKQTRPTLLLVSHGSGDLHGGVGDDRSGRGATATRAVCSLLLCAKSRRT